MSLLNGSASPTTSLHAHTPRRSHARQDMQFHYVHPSDMMKTIWDEEEQGYQVQEVAGQWPSEANRMRHFSPKMMC
ncbi:unnamed protein product [Arctogadus glacialis]